MGGGCGRRGGARVWAWVRVGTASWAWDVGRLRKGARARATGGVGETGSRAGRKGGRDAPSEEVGGSPRGVI